MIYFYQQISKNHIGDVLVSVLDASNKVDRGFNDGEAVSGSMDYVIQGDALVTLYLHGYNIQRLVSDILLYTCVMLYLIRTIYY
jgi:hypothetical protein